MRNKNTHNSVACGTRSFVLLAAIAAVPMLTGMPAARTQAYEIHTHSIVSYYAASRSALLADPSLFADWGYGDPSLEQFTTSEAGTGTARDLVAAGARLEDDVSTIKRVFNHFYDPQYDNHQGRGLDTPFAVSGHQSPTWALEDVGDVTSIAALSSPGGVPQQFSFREAQYSYLNSLTLPAAQDRRAAAARMFRTLGHVIHHLQDMAQPQHTRNDTHSPYEPSGRSFYERYTEQVVLDSIGGILMNNAMPIPSFPTARRFWTENALAFRGMADFTARNYVSYETGYRTFVVNGVERVFGHADFPLPNGLNQDSSQKNIATRTIPLRQLNGSVTNEPMDYVVGSVFDGAYANGITYPNKLLAAASLLDKPLAQHGQSRVFSVNQAVFDDHYAILLPRAEAFSAGLINHFFRGRLGFARSGSTTTWNVQNLSAQPLAGTFRVYTESGTGVRAAHSGPFSGNLAPSATLPVVLTEPPAGTQRLIVVFQGRIGQEPASTADPNWFATAGKVVNYLPPPIPCGNPVSAAGSSAGTTIVQELGTQPGPVQVEFEAYSIPDAFEIRQVRPDSSLGATLITTNGQVSGWRTWTFQHDPAASGTTRVRVRVTGNSDPNTLWTTTVSCPGQSLDNADRQEPRIGISFVKGGTLGSGCPTGYTDVYLNGMRVGRLNFNQFGGGDSFSTTVTAGTRQFYSLDTNVTSYGSPGSTCGGDGRIYYQDRTGQHYLLQNSGWIGIQ